MTRRTALRALAVLAAAVLALPGAAPAAEPFDVIEGWLAIVWGDGAPGSDVPPATAYFVTSDDAVTTPIAFSPEFVEVHGGLVQFQGQRVRVWLEPAGERDASGVRRAAAIEALAERAEGATRDVTGPQPWVSILCKFADKPAEPKPLSFFQGMYDNTFPRLDHYWRTLSYGAASVAGSVAIDWKVLPYAQSHYVPTPGENQDANKSALFDDCTAAADPFVNFNTGGFVGINMMFNDLLDCCAWGGGRWATLDGASRLWRVTWEPPWGFANISVMAHEMGHGFGLPHSNNWDNDGYPYDNTWDVMSDTWHHVIDDATYGSVGQHTIAAHKDYLGWLADDEVLTVSGDGVHTAILDDLALASTPHYRMVKIATAGGRYWTVETRDTATAYDADLPGNAVIVHEVDTSRSEWAWAYDTASTGSRCTYSDCESVMFRVGETFTDAANAVRVDVLSATPDGFLVRVVRDAAGGMIFFDGFESTNALAWSGAQPLILPDPGR